MRYLVLFENVKCCDVLDMRRCISSSLNLLIYMYNLHHILTNFLCAKVENINTDKFIVQHD